MPYLIAYVARALVVISSCVLQIILIVCFDFVNEWIAHGNMPRESAGVNRSA